MEDVANYTWPEIKICDVSLKWEYCYKNHTLTPTRRGRTGWEYRIRPCFKPVQQDIRGKGGMSSTRPRKLNYTLDYWYPLGCVRVNLSKVNMHKSEELYYVEVKDATPTKLIDNQPSFYVTVEGDRFQNYEVKYGIFEINIIETTSTIRLQSPFHSNCSNGKNEDNIFPGPYTKINCVSTQLFHTMLQKCGDVIDPWQKYIKPHYKRGKNLTYRSTLDCVTRYRKDTALHRQLLTLGQCPLSCREVTYKTEGKQYLTSRGVYLNDTSRLMFRFKTDRSTVVMEVPTYTSDDLFSDIGSWLGLLVGMSFLSLIEIVTFVYAVAREQCCSKCRARIR